MHPLFQIANKNHGGSVAEVEIPNNDLVMVSQELIDAIGSGDAEAVADAIKACFTILEMSETDDADQV